MLYAFRKLGNRPGSSNLFVALKNLPNLNKHMAKKKKRYRNGEPGLEEEFLKLMKDILASKDEEVATLELIVLIIELRESHRQAELLSNPESSRSDDQELGQKSEQIEKQQISLDLRVETRLFFSFARQCGYTGQWLISVKVHCTYVENCGCISQTSHCRKLWCLNCWSQLRTQKYQNSPHPKLAAWVELASCTKGGLAFRETIIHLVGRWPGLMHYAGRVHRNYLEGEEGLDKEETKSRLSLWIYQMLACLPTFDPQNQGNISISETDAQQAYRKKNEVLRP